LYINNLNVKNYKMKNLLSIFTVILIGILFTSGLEAQTLSAAKMRTSTIVRASQIMLDTLDDADSVLYIFPGRSNPFACQYHLQWTNISGTIRDTVTISLQGENAVRLNTTNTTTGSTLQGADYVQTHQFVIGATGLIGGIKDTIINFTCNGAQNIKIYHRSTGTQSTRVKGHAKIYVAANTRSGTTIN